MSLQIAEATETDHPVDFTASRANGGITGLTVALAVRDGDTVATPSWLDFNDNTFKTAGWTNRTMNLTEVSAANAPGTYALAGGLDINAWSGLTAGARYVILEFEITAGSAGGVASRRLFIVDSIYALATVAGIFGRVMETGFDFDRYMRIALAALAGKVSGGPTDPVFRDLLDANDMIDGPADSSGNRPGPITYGS